VHCIRGSLRLHRPDDAPTEPRSLIVALAGALDVAPTLAATGAVALGRRDVIRT
jgi:hypothetical protein